MKSLSWLLFFALLVVGDMAEQACASSLRNSQFDNLIVLVKELVPSGWIVADIKTNSIPYGWELPPGGDLGLGITLVGSTTVRGAKREAVKEGITIYAMPKECSPVELSSPGAPEDESIFIGVTRNGIRLYVKDWSEIQTWSNWKTDIQKHLEVEPNRTGSSVIVAHAEGVAFTNLQQAVDYISTALESTNFDGIVTACLDDRRKPNNALLKSLQGINQAKPLRHLYADKSFPTNAPTFKLGGHMKELGFTHIDFVQTNGVWKLQAIWQCR